MMIEDELVLDLFKKDMLRESVDEISHNSTELVRSMVAQCIYKNDMSPEYDTFCGIKIFFDPFLPKETYRIVTKPPNA